jgi:hypothetical protein
MVYRAAIIGCGKIGSEFSENPAAREMVLTHAEAYHRRADTQLSAVCDLDPEKLARCGDLWG